MSDHPVPRLDPVPGRLTDRLNHQLVGAEYEGRPVEVLMSDGRWHPGAVTEEWQTRDRRWCVMLRYPILGQGTSSTSSFFHDPDALRAAEPGDGPGQADEGPPATSQ